MKNGKPFVTIFETIATVLFILILVFVFLQIVFRYVLRISVPWTEEGSRFLLISMVFLGSVITLATNRDIKLTLLSSKVSRRTGSVMDIFVHLVIVVFGIIFLSGSITMARLNWQIPSLTLPGINLGHLYLTSGVASIAAVIISAVRILREVKQLITVDRSHPIS